jgi:hypothetical protein
MAKGKHATALFEVIHASKQFGGKDKSGLLRTPKWWFKGRPGTAAGADASAAAPKDPNDPTAGATLTSPLAQQKPAVTGAARASESAAGAEPVAAASANDPTQLDEFAAPPRTPAPAATATAPAVDVDVDSSHQRITFRFTYTSALVTCFAIVVVVALAYLVGRQMSRGPAQAMGGPSTDEVRQGPARPEVLDVGRGSRSDAGAPAQRPSASEPDDSTISTSSQPNRSNPAPARSETPKLPPAAPGKRVTGLNYLIIQSYPDEASAKAAVTILQQHGVGATIEKGLRGYSNSWFTVVGMEPFARTSSPEYAAYVNKLEQISEKFASRRSFKAFDPQGYKWDRP